MFVNPWSLESTQKSLESGQISGALKFSTFLCQKTFCSGLSAFVCFDYKQNIFGTFRFLESRNLSPSRHSNRYPESFFEQKSSYNLKERELFNALKKIQQFHSKPCQF